MSIRQELRSTVRRELIAKLSEANQVLHGLTEGNKDLVLDHIFANIAVEGTSGETIYPTTMVKCHESFNPSLPVVKEYSLAEVVNKIRVYKESHTNNDIKLMTFRQVCAAFAIDAQLGLVKFYRLNMHTNIYKKHPKTEGPDRSHQGQGFAEQSSSSLQAEHALSPPIPPPSHHSRALYSSP